jgi:hypothetical protein
MSNPRQFRLVGDLDPDVLESGRHPEINRLLEEARAHARKAYMDGSIRQMWLQSPGPGAVAILEANSLDDAQKVALSFPLAQAGLLKSRLSR